MRSKFFCCVVLALCLLFLAQGKVFASHLKIDSVLVSVIDPEKKAAKLQFNVSWDNSWKDEINCDGVWLFAKYKLPNGSWKHMTLKNASEGPFNYNDQAPGFSSKGDSQDLGMWIPAEKKGAFIFRVKAGSGTVSSKNVILVWDYAADNVLDNEMTQVTLKVFGLEMVYIPEGKHYIGDPKGPDGPDNTFYTY
ncbi:MAG: hypothetical protein WCL25_05665, partial [bacterium]